MGVTNQEFIGKALSLQRGVAAMYGEGLIGPSCWGVHLTYEKFMELFPSETSGLTRENVNLADSRPHTKISTVVDGVEFFALIPEEDGRR